MTGSSVSGANLDRRRRRALFRAWRRGTREMDLLLGSFADAYIGELSSADFLEFEALLDLPDPDLFAWIVGQGQPAPGQAPSILHAIMDFHAARHEQE